MGRAIALALAGEGAIVAVSDVVTNDGLLDKVVEEIHHLGSQSMSLKIDISQKSQVDAAIKRITEKFGRIDILVNCAGVWIPGSFGGMQ